MRIISEVRPDIFIFENVKGFYSSNNGKDFTIALQTIADLGLYECQWQLLNTAWFLPQNRERVYFVGSLTEGSRPEVFPIRNGNEKISAKGYGKSDYAGCISTTSSAPKCNFDGSTTLIRTNISTAIDCNYGKGLDNHGPLTMIISRPHGFNKGGEKKLPCLRSSSYEHNEFLQISNSLNSDGYLMRGARNRDENGKAVLTSMCERRIRRLTPIECERLQGFPDNWTQKNDKGIDISDTQRYKMCGNAVSVPVVKAIGERLHFIKGKE